jgi:hypothetical protein
LFLLLLFQTMKVFFFNSRAMFSIAFTLMFNLFSVSFAEAGTQPVKEKRGLAKVFSKKNKAPTIDSVAAKQPVPASLTRPSCVPPRCKPQVVERPQIVYKDVEQVVERIVIKEVEKEVLVEKPVIREIEVDIPVYKPVPREIVVDVPVYKPVPREIHVDIPVYVPQPVQVPVSIPVYVPQPVRVQAPMVHCPPPRQVCSPIQQVQYASPCPPRQRVVRHQPCPQPRQYMRQPQYRQPPRQNCPPPGYNRGYGGNYVNRGGHPRYGGGGFNFNPVNINQGNNIMYRSGAGNHNPNAGLAQGAIRHALAQGGLMFR